MNTDSDSEKKNTRESPHFRQPCRTQALLNTFAIVIFVVDDNRPNEIFLFHTNKVIESITIGCFSSSNDIKKPVWEGGFFGFYMDFESPASD